MKTIMEISDYSSDQEWVKTYIGHSYEMMPKINAITRKHGLCGFPTREDGSYWRLTTPNIPIKTQLCNIYDILTAFSRELKSRGAECHERIMITRLLVRDGRVQGAFGFNYRTGESYLFKAPVVLMAAGSCSFKVDVFDCCGEPFKAAYEAGARMVSFDRAGALVRPRNVMRAGILDNVPMFGLPELLGAKFVNTEGTELIKLMTAQEIKSGRLGIDAAIQREVEAGRGPIYEDCTAMPDEAKKFLYKLKKANYKRVLVEYGLDPLEYPIPLHPEHVEQTYVIDHTNRMGGIDIDHNGQKNIAGLYVAGDCSAPKTCAQHPFPGVELGWAMFSGGWIGAIAAKACEDAGPVDDAACESQGKEGVMDLVRALNLHGTETPDEIKEKIIHAIVPYDVNHCDEEALAACIAKLEHIRDHDLPQAGIASFYQLREYVEASSMLWVALMMTGSEIRRKESRLGVRRKDYPMMDNIHWLKLIGFKKTPDGPEFFTEDIATPYYDVPRTILTQAQKRV